MELDEEDSHLCIRCNQTIIGLQNYVNHRQRNCSSSSQSVKPSPKPFSANFDFLDAHRTKKIENYADFSFGDERDDDEDDDEVAGQNEKSAEGEFNQCDYDFFSSLELQCMSKPPHVKQPNQQKTIKTRSGDEWIDESSVKKVFKFYEQNESESDDESEESEPEVPRNYTQGKWKPGSRPPSNFTGGKWKPDTKVSAWDDNESSNDAEKSIEIDVVNPPPSHTKGKWMPGTKITKLEFKDENVGEKSQERDNFWCSFCSRNLATRAIYDRHLKSNLHRKRTRQQNDLEEAADALPLTNLDELSTHFTVATSDRAATSTPQPREGENRRQKFRSRSKVTCEVCDMKLPLHLLGNHLISHFHYRKMLQHPKKSFDIVLENFHKIIIQSPFQCHPCKFYFNTQEEFMRHWNSIGHVEVVDGKTRGGGKFLCSLCKFQCVENGDMTLHLNGDEHQQVVTLINRSKPIVIRQLTPLRCSKCSMEFRFNIQLMQHLKMCEVVDDKFNFAENFICDLCPKAFQSALSLQKHQLKAHKTSVFFCSECRLTFKTAKEAKLHRAAKEHKSMVARKRMRDDPELKAKLQKICPICGEEKLDNLDLKLHILAAHPERKFSCGRCGMKFAIAQEVSRHVRDKACKFYSKASCTVTSSDSVKVPKSSNQLGLDLIENNFADISPSTFAMTTVNETEDNDFGMIIGELEGGEGDEQVVEITFACKLCEFSANSHAEFLFHESLHRLPLDQDSKQKIECEICKKFFSRQSLREHLRQHTNERIFECTVDGCPMSFTRKANLKNHIVNVHKNEETVKSLNVCKICGKNFQSKYILEQHKFVHRDRIASRTFPCQLPNCIYIGRNATDTRNHLLTHNDERLFICTQPSCDYRGQTMEQLRSHSRKHQELEFKFTCEHCDYKTKLSSHLKRHMRVHEMDGGKIYKCPHCDYACNNSENLRKHVLKTNKHPGKFLYECIYCDNEATKFRRNSMKEYQSHLQTAHNVTKAPR